MQKKEYNNQIRNSLPLVFKAEEVKELLGGELRAPLKYIERMVASGIIIRLKKGFFTLAEGFDPLLAASALHGPSYISFETALGFYGMIPERVEQIISVVDNYPLKLKTPESEYIYHSQNRKLFSEGMGIILNLNGHNMMIATKEKALLDTLAREKLLASNMTLNEVYQFVIKSLRIEEDDLKKLSVTRLNKMAQLYRNNAPKIFITALKERV